MVTGVPRARLQVPDRGVVMNRYFVLAFGFMVCAAFFFYRGPAEPPSGRPVSAAEAAALVGGGCGKPQEATCPSGEGCTTGTGCLGGGDGKLEYFPSKDNDACNANCSIFKCSESGCSNT